MPCLLAAQISESLLERIELDYYFDEYEGSIYVNSKPKISNVNSGKSGTYEVKLKYDALYDAFEYKDKSELYHIIKDPDVYIVIDDESYYYREFKDQQGLKINGYYALIESQYQYRLYKKYTVEITEPKKDSGSSSYGLEPGKLKLITTYFLEENDIIIELPLNGKELLNKFDDKKQELTTYLKKEKVRFKKEEDLIRFVAKYNALKSIDTIQNRSPKSKLVRN